MTQASQIRPTTAVRRFLRGTGVEAHRLYTNKYKHCRTVKMYGALRLAEKEHLLGMMTALGFTGITIKSHATRTPWGTIIVGRTTTIIRIPN